MMQKKHTRNGWLLCCLIGWQLSAMPAMAADLKGSSQLTLRTVAAECTCRAYGNVFQLGDIICMRKPRKDNPSAMEKVQCGFVLNNTAWKPINEKCDPLT
jgi:hypothetical protein